MIIRVEHGDFEENEVILRCKTLDDEILEILAYMRGRASKLAAYKDGEVHLVQPAEVYYIEAIEGKTFIYTGHMVLESNLSLTALQEAHGDMGIIRIGKSQLVNLHHVKKLISMPNSRIKITLKNGENLIVSRHFVHLLKEKLGMLD